MAARFEQPVVNSTDASGSAEFIVEDYKLFTGRFIFTATGGSPTVTYAVKVKGESATSSANAYVLKSGTVTANSDILINNNDGDGCPITAYSILVEWSAMADGVVNIGMRKSY